MMTRAKSGIFKLKLPYIGIAKNIESLNSIEPLTISAALINKIIYLFNNNNNLSFDLIALVMAFFFAAVVSARDLAPSIALAASVGVSLPDSGAVVRFSLAVSALTLI
ncbi:hypothetical protein Q3G72_033488 [Acer saccharum]|nr:hypothetical protein Q3G72_033488 [Acer saccharum]